MANDLHPLIVKKELQRRTHASQFEVADQHISVSSFVTEDLHQIIMKTGDLCAFYETEGIDPVCLSEDEVVNHAKILTEALNEADPRLSVHQYWIKDRAVNDAELKEYRDSVVKAVDAARAAQLETMDFYSTRLIYCFEWKSSFSGGQSKVAALLPLLANGVKGMLNSDARKAFGKQLTEALGGEKAVLVTEARLVDEIVEFKSAMEALVSKMERLTLGGDLDSTLAEAIGATKLEFTRLVGTEAYRVLHRLWNWSPDTRLNMVFPEQPDRLNHWLAQDNLDMRDPQVLWSGDMALRLYSVRGMRDPVSWDVLRHVRNLNSEMVIHTRFTRMGTENSSSYVAGCISKAHNFGGFSKGDPMKPKRINDMRIALHESVRGKPFGKWNCTIALAGDTRAEVVETSKRFEATCAAVGLVFRKEDFSKDYAFFSMLPGNSQNEYCTRTIQTATAVAALMPYRQAEGRGVTPPRDCPFPEALCSINTYNPETKQAGLPVNWYMSCGNIAHWAVLGKTGGGKSFLVNFVLTNWGRYSGTAENPTGLKRWIIDKGHSYKSLCSLLGGSYINIADPATKAKMNPFDLPPDEIRRNAPMLIQLLGLMMAASSTSKVELEESEASALSTALEGMSRQLQDTYAKGEVGSMEMFAGFLKGNPKLLGRLESWLPGGEDANIVPNAGDGMGEGDMVVFNFESTHVPDSILGPVFFYILSRINSAVESEELARWRKIVFIDEAAAFITPRIGDWKSETVTSQIRNFIRVAWKTWRKKGGVLALATQEASDLCGDEAFWSTFKGQVPTKILLAQKTAGEELVNPKTGLGIPVHLLDEVQKLPLGAFLVDAGGMRRYLYLKPDATSYAIYTTDPKESDFRTWWLQTHPYTEDYTPLMAFEDIGKHIQMAKRGGSPERYYHGIRVEHEGKAV